MSKPTNGRKLAFPIQVHASPDSEVNYGLTASEYAAIKLCVPDSGTPWLDEMIRKSLRDKLAGQALAGLTANADPKLIEEIADGISGGRKIVDVAYQLADRALERGKK